MNEVIGKMIFARVLVLSNGKMIKDIFNDSNWTGRPHFDGFDIYEDERLGSFCSLLENVETYFCATCVFNLKPLTNR